MQHHKIFDSHFLGEEIPQGFNAVKIALDGRMNSNLDWNIQDQIKSYLEKGLNLFWEIDLGLFSQLNKPLNDQTQLLSLILSLEHFRDTLWREFREHTIGLCLYRGNADFSLNFPWDSMQIANLQEWLKQYPSLIEKPQMMEPALLSKELWGRLLLSLFCRDVVAEYLNLLADRLPDQLNCYLLLDGSKVEDPALLAQLVTKERFSRLRVGLKGDNHFVRDFLWEGKFSGQQEILCRQLAFKAKEKVNLGICLPSSALFTNELREILVGLQQLNVQFRLIPETFLTSEWDGLDNLFVVSQAISFQGRRKLQGFCAAGGTVVCLGGKIGLPQELSFEEYLALDYK